MLSFHTFLQLVIGHNIYLLDLAIHSLTYSLHTVEFICLLQANSNSAIFRIHSIHKKINVVYSLRDKNFVKGAIFFQ
jgi:hypothetical protein